uniref:Uncharacterized protein n=1 Tax=Quercus lobata TaxID=97700 RepID=A0A7N2L7S9_QUELO
MADSQSDSHALSVRIVSIDHYMAPPTHGLDVSYSSFQGGKVNEVPVIRIYGSTPAGQKTGLHVHGVLPYLCVPCADISLQPHEEGDAYTHAISLALEKALKGGTVLDGSLQPYESHIPFILQFLIDYNLYGMGHMHLSKMKFRHPIPDTFSPRKSNHIGLHKQHMDKLTCMPTDFQADPSCDASFSSPIWISSTILADWIWQLPREFEASSRQDIYCNKRRSVCELEGDASIDDVLNQQFKNYSSLSQTRSEVKMVQSLVPIWEVCFSHIHFLPFEGDPKKQILTYTEAVRTIDPMKAVGKPHTLWVNFARLYEKHSDLVNARVIFDKAVQVNYKAVDHLASVWCEWAEMELRHQNFKEALELMRRATAEPSVEVKQKVAANGNEPVQIKLYRSLKLWTFYVDLEESLGTLESTRIVYEWIWDLRIATPQIILNYAFLLEAPADAVKPLYLQYAKLEEDYGLAKRAMKVYDQATKAVPNNEKLCMYEIYIARAAEIFGVPKTWEIYKQAIESGLLDKDAKTMCLKYAELEKSLGEIDRARAIYVFVSQFADPRSDVDFWNKWHEFEVQHGNEDTFREMLQTKRSVSASYSQTHYILPEYLMQKDQRLNLDDARDKLKQAGVAEDEMAALERQLVPVVDNGAAKDKNRRVGFVSAGVESQSEGGIKVTANHEDIELPEESDSDDDDKVEIAQKDVPSAVFGGLVRKRDEADNDAEAQDVTATKEKDSDNRLRALERIKRLKKA